MLIGIRMDPTLDKDEGVKALDFICLLYFTVEVVVKLVACGVEPWKYVMSGWNNFDFVVVVLSWYYSTMKVVRIVRLLRVPKLVSAFPQMQVIIEGLIQGLYSVVYILLLMLLQFYMFGMMLFKENDPWHFGTISRTFVSLFRCATLEDWTDVMYINIYGCHRYPENPLNDASAYTSLTGMSCKPEARGWVAAFYFVAFIVIGSLVTLSLFVGVVTTGMQDAADSLLK